MNLNLLNTQITPEEFVFKTPLMACQKIPVTVIYLKNIIHI